MHQPAHGKPYVEPKITIKGQMLKELENFTDFGNTLSKPIVMDDVVNTRLAKVSTVFGRFNGNVWNRRGISEATKIKVVLITFLPFPFMACKEAKPLSHDLSEEECRHYMAKTHPRYRSFNFGFSFQHLHHLDAITAALGRSCCTHERSPPPEETALRRTVSRQALPMKLEKKLQRYTEGLHEIFRCCP